MIFLFLLIAYPSFLPHDLLFMIQFLLKHLVNIFGELKKVNLKFNLLHGGAAVL